MKDEKSLFLLSENVVISQDTQSENDVFLTVDLTICDDQLNGNDQGVTVEWMDDIVERNDDYTTLPMYADVKRLLAGEYDDLTHLYNRFNGKFGTTQIGSMLNFRTVKEDGVTKLQATARFPKREADICAAIVELYEAGKLCFSFEVKYRPEDTHLTATGGLVIDKGEHNVLTGVAVVSRPACGNSVALDLVAEMADGEEMTAERGEQNKMPDEKEKLVTAEDVDPSDATEESGADETSDPTEENGGDNDAQTETPAADNGGGNNTQTETPAADNGGGGEPPQAADPVVIDPSDEYDETKIVPARDTIAEDESAVAEDANAEVVMHRVETCQTYEKGNPEWDEPDHVITHVEETVVETVDGTETQAVAEDAKDQEIAALKVRIAELEEIEAKYNKIMEAEAEKALAEKRKRAKAFAEKQGLDVEAEDVATAIAELNYEKIAELSMDGNAVKEQEVVKAQPTYVSMATFVDMNMSDDAFGNMLRRRSENKE